MNSLNKSRKLKEEDDKIFITTRYQSNDKNNIIKINQREISPSFIKNSDIKEKITTCRKPIILKGNLPSVFDIDRLKIIKR